MQFFDFQIFPQIDSEKLLNSASGSNQKNLLLVLKKLSPDKRLELLELLSKILKAVHYDLEKDALLIELTEKDAFSFVRFQTKTMIEKMIVFGIEPKNCGLNLSIKLYQEKHFQNWSFLFANDLQEIALDKNKKALLWNALKIMFLSG